MRLLHELLQTIKRAAVDAVESGEPAAVFVGRVAGAAPLAVCVNERLTLTGRQLLCLEMADDLAAGERVAVLRFCGGQRYLVLGRVQ